MGKSADLTRPFALICCVITVLAGPLVGGLAAQEDTLHEEPELAEEETPATEMGDLAKTSQNPVGNLISLPFQNNTNFGLGPEDRTQNILNIQPVIPVSLSKKWNLINRTIIPVMYQPEIVPGEGSTTGIGDTSYTGFISPREPGNLIWGVGPVISIPTSTDDALGSGAWAAGPSVVLLRMPGSWVVGLLMSNIWSFDSDADINFFLSQIFVNYNMKGGWFLTSAPVFTANWEAESGQKWTIPVGGGGGRVFKIGKQPVNSSAQIYYNLEKPDFGADWQFRFQFTFLFPK
jgi:hypothetical protein